MHFALTKSARRFFVEGAHASGASVEIDGGDARKIRRVLRLRDGDPVEIIDSAGTSFAAAIALDGERVTATLGALLPVKDAEVGLRFDVAQALPKGQKMDFVVEKLTELGVETIVPFRCERSLVRGPIGAKEKRWRRLASAAAAQSGRHRVPMVCDTLPAFDALLQRFEKYDAVAFAWELAAHVPLWDALPELLRDARRALLIVGPEGGFTHEEAEKARAQGAALLWMGPRILRAETAPVVLLAIADAIAMGRNYRRARRT